MTRREIYPGFLGVLTQLVIEPLIGAPYLSTANWLRDFYSWPDERRREWQHARFQHVVALAARDVPFYRRLLSGRRADSVSRGDLPVVSKEIIRTAMDQFLADGWREMPRVAKQTGGTTGDPWNYPLDMRAWTHIYAASLHFYERAGYRYGERVVLLGAPPSLDEKALKMRIRRRLEQHEVRLAGYAVDPEASARRVMRAAAMRGALWYGFAGTIAAMADAVLDHGLQLSGPRVIVTTAEPLQPAWRERITAAFGVMPFDQYGCNDGGVLSQTCARGRFHVAENVSIVEVIDGDQVAPPGVEGEIAVTNLHARALPFLRYKTGDRAVLGDGPCPCGTPGVTLERVAGRQVDRLDLPDGSQLSGLSFGRIFMSTPHVRRWQVVQVDQRRLTVRLDVDAGFDPEEAAVIQRGFRERVGDGVHVELETGAAIEQTRGGKQKIVVRYDDPR